MKAITICQPYAEWIACGQKRVENRTWSTLYRGELAIHAGKSRAWLPATGDRGQGLGNKNGAPYTLYPDALIFGAVIAVVKLVAVLRLDEIAGGEYAWVRKHPYSEGPWCWVLEEVRRVEPVYCNGALGLWNVHERLMCRPAGA